MIKAFKILFLFFNLFSLIYSEKTNEENTKNCLEEAKNSNCGTFTNCCNKKCDPNQNQNHKCFALMGVIQKDQTFCSCSPSTINTENNQQNQQSFNKFFDDKFPSKSIFSWNNDDNSKSSSSSSSSSSLPSFFNNNLWKSPSSLFGFSSIPSPQQQQNNNIFNSSFSGSTSQTSEKQIGIQKQQNQLNRPTPGNPSDGRHLFLSTSTQTSSATGLKRINKDGSLTAKIGRKIDFVGGIILLFVFDLLLLSLTI